MEAIGGLTPTGRQFSGACTDLVELVDGDRLRHAALVFHSPFRGHEALGASLDALRGAMSRPGVVGLAPLVHDDGSQGAWVYLTGKAWTVSEVARTLTEAGEPGSIRAGLELCYLAAEVLLEASDLTRPLGMGRHGSLDPLRLMVKEDGQVVVLGYGLPAVDLDAWIADPRSPIHEDALRYAPPERFTDAPLDLSSDLFTLTLIGLEFMIGRPVYDGLLEDIAAQAQSGDAVRRVYGWQDALPATVLEVLVKALKPDRDARYREGVDYLYAVHDLLSSIDADGPPLVEFIARFRGVSSRDQLEVSKGTGHFSPEEIAEMTADLDAVDAAEVGPPRRPRAAAPEEPVADEVEEEAQPKWGKVARGGAETPVDDAREQLKRRLRDRRVAPSEDRPRPAPRRLRARDQNPPAPQPPADRDVSEQEVTARSAAAELLERLRGEDGAEPAVAAEVEPQVAHTPPAPASPTLEVRAAGRVAQLPWVVGTDGATVSAQAIEALQLRTHDLSGHFEQWWAAADPELRPEEGVDLVAVPNRVFHREIEVRGEAPTRFHAPVGSAVPGGYLRRHLCDLLGVSPSDVTLAVGDRELGPWDLPGDSPTRIVLTVR